MKLTKSQKISSSLLAAALCALAVDQLCGSSSPVARATNSTPVPQIAGKQNLPQPDELPQSHTIAARLRASQTSVDNVNQIRDAFAPSSHWIGSDEADHSQPLERALKFKSSHQLKAIVESNGVGQAMVDRCLIRVGQSIDGFQLRSVSNMTAVFAEGEEHVVLRLINSDLPTQDRTP